MALNPCIRTRTHICAALLLSATSLSGGALAQTAAAPDAIAPEPVVDEEGAIESSPDIIVTATRRATRLQETPISVSAVTGEELERNNIRQFSDLESMLPNVRVPDGLNGGGNSITIRGITAQARQGTGIEQPAGAYLDQVYYGPRGFLDRVIFDIDRIEVLRGPQGTLWGRNAASGAISYTTRRPTASLDAYARGSFGNYGLRSVEGAISGPIVSDLLNVRLSGVHYQRDGSTHDVNGGSFGTENQDALRAQLAFTPADGFDLVVIGQHLWSKRRHAPLVRISRCASDPSRRSPAALDRRASRHARIHAPRHRNSFTQGPVAPVRGAGLGHGLPARALGRQRYRQSRAAQGSGL